MFVVAAHEVQPAPPGPRVPGQPTWLHSDKQPVGTQHAAAPRTDPGAPRLALCGVDLAGWMIFPTRPFDPRGTGSCHDCTRLLPLTPAQPAE